MLFQYILNNVNIKLFYEKNFLVFYAVDSGYIYIYR